MKESKEFRQLYERASNTLAVINDSWNDSEKKSPRLLICFNVKDCMSDLLSAFLIMNKKKPAKSATLHMLIEQCAAIDERFKGIDLRWISCKDHPIEEDSAMYCTSTHHTQACTWILNGIKKVMDDSLKNPSTTPPRKRKTRKSIKRKK